ncbi:hypothetical protein VPH35_086897 [Triticum aestivum]
MGNNKFHGELPSSLTNATNHLQFEIQLNSFSGAVPPDIGELQSLQWLALFDNALQAKNPHEWEFIQALTNCTQLQGLELDNNRFGGAFPSAVSNLSITLYHLSLTGNEISGHIPREVGNLVGLSSLQLQENYITGSLPSSLSMLQNLRVLWVGDNNMEGQVQPSILGNLTELIDFNNFTGTVPSSLFNITTLSVFLDISYNYLEGPIPPEIGNLQNLVVFNAMFNRFSGEIPSTLGKCLILQNIFLQNNLIMGNIPSLLTTNFQAKYQFFFGDFSSLSYLNLSFNDFYGEVPTIGIFANSTVVSVLGNSKLCGGVHGLHLSPCPIQISKRRHKFPKLVIIVSLVATTICVLLLLLFFLACHKKRTRGNNPTISMPGHKLVSYQQLAHGTNGFSTANLLGNGSYGSVYRATLHDDIGEQESIVAVKVLKLTTPGALKSFTFECEAMRNLRHRSLVKIITTCSSIDFNGNDFKAILFDFMPNGSLGEWLHPNSNHQPEARHLSLAQRLIILLDVAYALDYLHCSGGTPIVHCDLKPSNVLLDSDMVAHVGDFGLSRILAEGKNLLIVTKPSVGDDISFNVTEYGAGNMVSTHGDSYSYGILILEMVTGRRPTDDMFDQGLSLHKYVEVAFDNRAMDIADPELVKEVEHVPTTTDNPTNQRKVDTLISLFKLGIFCSEEIPSSRISTKDIVNELRAIKG